MSETHSQAWEFQMLVKEIAYSLILYYIKFVAIALLTLYSSTNFTIKTSFNVEKGK